MIAVLFLLGKSLAAFRICRYRADTLTEDAISLQIDNSCNQNACMYSHKFELSVLSELEQGSRAIKMLSASLYVRKHCKVYCWSFDCHVCMMVLPEYAKPGASL